MPTFLPAVDVLTYRRCVNIHSVRAQASLKRTHDSSGWVGAYLPRLSPTLRLHPLFLGTDYVLGIGMGSFLQWLTISRAAIQVASAFDA